MKKATVIIRILLGTMMFIFGINGFFHFMPALSVNQKMGMFLGAIAASKFMFPLISLVLIISGALLLLNRFVPLVCLILFTVLINAFLAHLFLDPESIGAAMFAITMNIFMLFVYRKKYFELIKRTSTL